MYKFFAILSTILILGSCGICNHLPQEHIVVRDSVAVSYRDSVVLVPKEVLMDVAPVDSSHLETTYAISDAWVDSLALLHHKLVQKPVKSEYKEKEVIKIQRDTLWKVEYKDKIVEKPVKYVPKLYKWSMGFSIFVILLIAAWIYLKISKADIGSLLKKN